MNPTELGMLWMSQYGTDRMVLDDSTTFYGQPAVGLSVMDDIAHQTGSLDMNPMMGIVGGEYSGQAISTLTTHSAPSSSILTGGNNDIYGIQQTVGSIHPALQHSAAYQSYTDIVDDDDVDRNTNNQFVHQTYDPIDDSSCYDSSNPLTEDSKEIINIDDFVMMNESNSYDDNPIIDDCLVTTNVKQQQISVSGNQKKAKKIEPVNRPGLVLKTPIAYKGNIDPSVIPIQRDGMAVCERCGAIGVKHTFYTKFRRFCSMACARGELYNLVCNDNSKSNELLAASNSLYNSYINSNNIDESNDENNCTGLELNLRVEHIRNTNYRFKMSDVTQMNTTNEITEDIENSALYGDLLPQNEIPQIIKRDCLPLPCPQEDRIISVRRRPFDNIYSFDWTPWLSKPNFLAAPVICFPHAPGYDMWDNIGVDMKVEVENTDCENQSNLQGNTPHSFWVATVLKICGYKALMRYEGFDNSSSDFWVNLCSSEVHSVGWCATRGKPLIPPHSIENRYQDWKDFLVNRLSGARTLPSNFYNKISESFKSRFRCGLNLEIVDKNRISQVKLATIHKIIGKRLYVKYFDSQDGHGFWCHEDSPLIHPVGWATTVRHNLSAPKFYMDRMLAGREYTIEVHEDDATVELFKMNFTFEEYSSDKKINGFVEGMKLEAVDPLNLSEICVATVMAVLKYGYMMIRIDSYAPDATGADWFCYHEKSPSIFPVGFCAANKIELTPPNGYTKSTFDWDTYLNQTNSIPASEHLFHRTVPQHGFRPGMKMECADLMDPRLVCVATVARCVERLIRVRFDGWSSDYDQWLDCESPDFYPVGWCVLVGHKLEGPPSQQKQLQMQKTTPKTPKKKKKKKNKNENTTGAKPGRPSNIKKEAQTQLNKQNTTSSNTKILRSDVKVEEEIEDEDYFDSENESFSRSDQSTPLPITPELNDKNKLNTKGNITCNNSILSNIQKTTKSSTAPPAERKVTSYINNTAVTSSKLIPRLSDNSNNLTEASVINKTATTSTISTQNNELTPETWSIHDVSQFLRVNDCIAHCDTFSRNKVDGKKLLQLSKDEIIQLLGMKVGPAIKIFDLIQQLKCKINPSKSRLLKINISKKFL